jgi:uncharacterized RDD family membrane protein YckC
MSSDRPDANAPGTQPGTQQSPGQPGAVPQGQQGGYPQGQQGGYPPGQQGGMPPQWSGQRPPSPVSEEATRVVGRRVIQYIIDYILAGIIPAIAYWLLDRGHGFLGGLGWLLATVISLAVYYWYWVERPRSHGGQTFGMQLFALRIISKDGGPARTSQLFIRGILLIVDTIFFGLVGFLTMICSRYRQRVGDHAAGTLVVPEDYPVTGQVRG